MEQGCYCLLKNTVSLSTLFYLAKLRDKNRELNTSFSSLFYFSHTKQYQQPTPFLTSFFLISFFCPFLNQSGFECCLSHTKLEGGDGEVSFWKFVRIQLLCICNEVYQNYICRTSILILIFSRIFHSASLFFRRYNFSTAIFAILFCIMYLQVLFEAKQWDHLVDQFKQEFCKLYGMTLEPLLNIYLQAGLSALKTPYPSKTQTISYYLQVEI